MAETRTFDALALGGAACEATLLAAPFTRVEWALDLPATGGAPAGRVYGCISQDMLERLFAVVCDHRVEPPLPGVIPTAALPGDLDLREAGETPADEMDDLWQALVTAIASGAVEHPGADGPFPTGPQHEDAAVLERRATGTFRLQSPHVEEPFDQDCFFDAEVRVEGHHVAWEVSHADSGGPIGGEVYFGWATFARGLALTSMDCSDWTLAAWACLAAAPVPAEGAEREAWALAWAHDMLTGAGLAPEVHEARS